MQEFLTYQLKVAACLSAFYLFYKLLLSRETFHRLNRAVITAAIALSFLLPVCRVTVYRYVQAVPAAEAGFGQAAGPVVEAASEGFGWWQPAAAVFVAGAVVAAARTLLSVAGVVRIIRRGRRERLEGGVVLVRPRCEVTPFSWIRWIVVGERDMAANGSVIMAHERAHIRLHHSYDLLATDVLAVMQWFNPAMWLLRAELRAVHEYEADAAVLAAGVDARAYQMLLIEKAVGGKWCSVANSLNHSKLKNRITMMLRKKSSRWATARVLFVVPLVCIAATAFARTVVVPVEDKVTKNYSIGEIASDTLRYSVAVSKTVSRADSVADVGRSENVVVVGSRQRDESGITEDVLVIIDGREASGSVELKSIDPNDIESIDVLKGKTAVERYGEKGRNGAIIVKSKSGAAKRKSDDKSYEEIKVVGYGTQIKSAAEVKTGDVIVCTGNLVYTNAKSALWIVDGREVSEEEAKALDSDNIRDLTVYKGGAAVERYGDKGRDGVIVIRTKSAAGDNTEFKHSIVTSGDKPVEYYVDGKKVTIEELEAINSGVIANMNIDKFDDHTRIDITTKKNE